MARLSLEYVLPLAELGIPLFPCGLNKQPILAGNGFKDATTDEATLRAWWGKYPDALFGMPTGEPSGIFVLDIDVDEGRGLNGFETLKKHGIALPNAPYVETRRGGRHYFFKDCGLGINSHIFGPNSGVDIRGNGGYVILWSFIDFARSNASWVNRVRAPDFSLYANRASLPEIPEWLKLKAKRAKSRSRSVSVPSDGATIPLADAGEIEAGCALLRHYIDNQDEQHEPGWYAMLGIARYTNDAEATAVRWSKDYKGFNKADTCAKMEQWKFPPTTCEELRTKTNQRALCKGCLIEKLQLSPWYHGAKDSATEAEGEIVVRGGNRPLIIDRCIEAVASMDRAFQRGGRLVHLCVDTENVGAIKRAAGSVVLRELTSERLLYDLSKVIAWKKFDARSRKTVAIDMPATYANGVIEHGEWPGVKPLRGIATTPTMRPDGSIITQYGYDAATGLFLDFKESFPNIPLKPTAAEIKAALAQLQEPFDEFPFVDDVDRSVHLSALLTRLARATLPTSPAFMYVATTPGSGKTKLAESISLIAEGRPASKMSFPVDNEEMQKVLLSVLIAGDRFLVFDNIKEGARVSFPALNGMLATSEWGGRILGKTENRSLPVTTMIALTGNNVVPYGDMVRRSLMVRLNPNTADPERRTFRIPNLELWLKEHRLQLVAAGLMLLHAFVDTHPALGLELLGSFEEWSALVMGTVVWLGLPSPLASQDEVKREDDSRRVHVRVLDALEELFEGKPFKVRDVVEVVSFSSGPSMPGQAVKHELYEALLEAAPNAQRGQGLVSADALGKYFKAIKGRMAPSGKRLITIDAPSRALMWRVAAPLEG